MPAPSLRAEVDAVTFTPEEERIIAERSEVEGATWDSCTEGLGDEIFLGGAVYARNDGSGCVREDDGQCQCLCHHGEHEVKHIVACCYPCIRCGFRQKFPTDEPCSSCGYDPAEEIARRFHESYERLAPSFGYETRKESAVPWEDVPEPNRRLMIAVARDVLLTSA